QRRGIRAPHLAQKLWPQQAPRVPAHVVRADAEEKAGADAVAIQCTQQPRHAFARAAESVHVHAQPQIVHCPLALSRCCAAKRDLSSCMEGKPAFSTWPARKKSSVLLMVSSNPMCGDQPSRRRAFFMLGRRWETS